MKTAPLKRQLPILDTRTSEYIIAHWLEAITNFYGYYHQLTACISQGIIEKELRSNLAYMGQCPVSELIKLTRCMQTELAKLTQAMDQVDLLKTPTAKMICANLAGHTLRLNQLSGQAQTRLYLIKRSAS
ncbi:hypothetical protein GO755_20445 [Spirosoma sp. HMF4905]|uniref:Uncharacterized protein n=1 Tax=Spirosoma arboris TaxID=2682092 RepID=A0A7K1SFE5_9BACT|nr:hypothetical protein [Spirosoma arboris]MVM32428.1 hypothetical protein [Spirosoma arboris]